MNRSAITALRRLRQYQLEKEQWLLQTRQREEMEKAALCEQARARIAEEMEIDPGAHPFHWKMRADAVRELSNILDQRQRQLRLAQNARNEQIQVVLGAKRKVEVVDKLLQRDAEARAAERDMSERKLLDDLAASRSARAEEEALY